MRIIKRRGGTTTVRGRFVPGVSVEERGILNEVQIRCSHPVPVQKMGHCLLCDFEIFEAAPPMRSYVLWEPAPG